MSRNTDLLPCPFCGGEARAFYSGTTSLLVSDYRTWSFVQCTECGAKVKSELSGPAAILNWNRRAPVVHLAPDFSITINAPAGGGGVNPVGCGLTPLPEAGDVGPG